MRQLLSSLGKLLRFDDAMTRLSCAEARVLEQRPVETEQRRDAADLILVERAQHPPPRVLAVDTVHDELGDGVLDLDPRVHLQEEVVAVAVEQPLDGADAAVTDRPGSVDPKPADPVTELVADRR